MEVPEAIMKAPKIKMQVIERYQQMLKVMLIFLELIFFRLRN